MVNREPEDFAALWQELMSRCAAVHSEGAGPGHRYVVMRSAGGLRLVGEPRSPMAMRVLLRVLCGEPFMLIAVELGMSIRTTSAWWTVASDYVTRVGRAVPLPLIISAQCWASDRAAPPGASRADFEHGGDALTLVSVPLPKVDRESSLSPAEKEVARYMIEGSSPAEIAVRRATSERTVKSQIWAIQSKLRLSSRYALIRHAVERGWFDG